MGCKSGASPVSTRVADEADGRDSGDWRERLTVLERNIEKMKEEEEKMKAEIRDLRDKLEEEFWAKTRLEEKVEELSDKQEIPLGAPPDDQTSS